MYLKGERHRRSKLHHHKKWIKTYHWVKQSQDSTQVWRYGRKASPGWRCGYLQQTAQFTQNQYDGIQSQGSPWKNTQI